MKITSAFLFLVFSIKALALSNVELGWTASCDTNVTGYAVYYSEATNYISTTSSIASCDLTTSLIYSYQTNLLNRITVVTNSLVISNLADKTTYVFSVVAVGAENESIYSSEILATTTKSLNTNQGSWAGITNWMVYKGKGTKPVLSLAPYSFNTYWFQPSITQTNFYSIRLTNNGIVMRILTTNYWISTNYSRTSVKEYLLLSDVVIPTNWTVLYSSDLNIWSPYLYGSNAPVCNLVPNNGTAAFFRLEF